MTVFKMLQALRNELKEGFGTAVDKAVDTHVEADEPVDIEYEEVSNRPNKDEGGDKPLPF